MDSRRYCRRCGQPILTSKVACACPASSPDAGPPDLQVDLPGPPGLRGEVDWAELQATTRWQPTVTTFGWRLKLLLTAPGPLLLLNWTASGAFDPGPTRAFTLGVGGPVLLACLWWTGQVWSAGPLPRTRDDRRQQNRERYGGARSSRHGGASSG